MGRQSGTLGDDQGGVRLVDGVIGVTQVDAVFLMF